MDKDIRAIWAEVAHEFPARDAQVFESLLTSDPHVMDVDRLFGILMQSGLYGGARRALAPGFETRYSTSRAKQMYIGPAFARLNKRLQKHGVPARIVPGKLKQTYILDIDK